MKEQNFKFKKSFGKLVEQMNDKQAGEFIKAVCGYVFLQKPMESKDEFLKGVYVYVKDALDTEVRDRENGRLGGILVAEKYKGQRDRVVEQTITENSLVSQVVIVSADAGGEAQDKSGKPFNKNGRPNTYNAYGGGKYAYANKNDSKAV
ncbi:MAG: hypothetical protein J1G01_01655 [Clostridiales bacterium]|nr:hypothetical protein [Clostridiales bacterium]